MCIFLASNKHPDYALIVLSNRDEFLDRDTAPAHQWEGTDVYAPQDLSKEAKGTWIGLSTEGKIAILLNFHEQTEFDSHTLSRGLLPKKYLLSSLSPREWEESMRKEHESELNECGGFTMVLGQLTLQDGRVCNLEVFSNRQEPSRILETPETVSISNGPLGDDQWIKTSKACELFDTLLQTSKVDLMQKLWDLLETDDLPKPTQREDLRKSIFIPHMQVQDRNYGTRTETVILVERDGHTQYLEKNVDTGEIRARELSVSLRTSD